MVHPERFELLTLWLVAINFLLIPSDLRAKRALQVYPMYPAKLRRAKLRFGPDRFSEKIAE
jgi:hypothetical protein